MNLLLDTQSFIWWITNPSNLSAEATNSIIDNSRKVYVSSVTPWEISIKKGINKFDLIDDFKQAVDEKDFSELPITYDHALKIRSLPMIHKDPFDRMLVAQAMVEDLTIITSDRNIAKYNVKIIRT